MKLRQMLEESESPAGRLFDLAIQGLIILSLVVFTCEYVLRLYAAENRVGFATSFFGIIDLIAIMPFYVASGLDLRSMRAFRLMRLVRILKLARYSAAMQRFHRAFLPRP